MGEDGNLRACVDNKMIEVCLFYMENTINVILFFSAFELQIVRINKRSGNRGTGGLPDYAFSAGLAYTHGGWQSRQLMPNIL